MKSWNSFCMSLKDAWFNQWGGLKTPAIQSQMAHTQTWICWSCHTPTNTHLWTYLVKWSKKIPQQSGDSSPSRMFPPDPSPTDCSVIPPWFSFSFFFLPLHSCVHNFWPFYTDHLFKERHGGVPRETARQVVAGWFLRNMANTHTHTVEDSLQDDSSLLVYDRSSVWRRRAVRRAAGIKM